MKTWQKTLAAGILISVISIPVFAHAVELNLPTLEQVLEKIPAPIKDFVTSVANSGSFSGKTQSSNLPNLNLNVDLPNASGVYSRADSWFFNITGVSLRDVFGRIWSFILWFLGIIPGLINWVISLLKSTLGSV